MSFGLPQALRSLVSNAPSVTRIPSRAVLSITGSQASEFLNGMLSSSIPDAPKRPFFSAILNAQGRIIYDLLIYSDQDINGRPGYFLEYDSRPSEAPPLHDLLKRFVLRSKVKLRDATPEFDVWAAWNTEDKAAGMQKEWQFAKSGAIEPMWPITTEHWPWGLEDRVLIDRRAPGMGCRYLVRKGDKPQVTSSFDEVSSDMYTLHRILRGVPEGVHDITPAEAFPMESNLDIMGGVDFRKGCYVGQELTVRTYHTGAVRKRILPVMLKSDNGELAKDALSPGLAIKPSVLASSSEHRVPRPRGSGKLLSSVQGVGLASMRLEHAAGVEKKELELKVTSGSEGSEETFEVEHWWPEWWPQQSEL
ncbi:ccr4 associated factor [Marasmius crinis-equi]|uniref:Ccr4 associated factor n=1 Tax=Marasmius crinis-equi TaxID=585013 RepID=A0ABR3FQJ4_9AGAR